jgi:hypothetical protein
LRDYLYFSIGQMTTTAVPGWTVFDRKSSAALVTFGELGLETADVYVRNGGVVEFKMKNLKNIKGKQVDDAEDNDIEDVDDVEADIDIVFS